MLKRILNIIGFLALVAVLVAGGVIRTRAVSGSTGNNGNLTQSENLVEPVLSGGIENAGEWVTLEGVVQGWEDESLTILTDTGDLVLIEGRGYRYLEEKGFSVNTGERVSLSGFYEGDTFEVALITNLQSGESLRLRGEDGRPAWAGGGSGG